MTDLPPTSPENSAIISSGKDSPLGPSTHGAPLGNRNALGHGAPSGNRNAAKHGLYSHWFSRSEHERLDKETLGELDDEELRLRSPSTA